MDSCGRRRALLGTWTGALASLVLICRLFASSLTRMPTTSRPTVMARTPSSMTPTGRASGMRFARRFRSASVIWFQWTNTVPPVSQRWTVKPSRLPSSRTTTPVRTRPLLSRTTSWSDPANAGLASSRSGRSRFMDAPSTGLLSYNVTRPESPKFRPLVGNGRSRRFYPGSGRIGQEALGLPLQVLQAGRRVVERQSLLGHRLRLLDGHGPDELLQVRDDEGHDAEIPESEAEEQEREVDVARHLAADGDRLPGPGAGIEDVLQETQDGRMSRLVERGDPLVGAVHRDGVGDEVVGAHAEEVHVGREHVGHHRGRGDLDHDADLHAVAGRLLQAAELPPDLFHDLLGEAHLGQGGDHGDHHLDVAARGGPEDGPDLGLEHVGLLEAEPDGPGAQEGVGLALEGAVVRHLVRAQVEGADDDAPVAQEAHGPRVRFLVVLLRGVEVVPQVEEFGAVEADALGPVGERRRDLLRRLDVGEDLHAGPVRRDGGQVLELLGAPL